MLFNIEEDLGHLIVGYVVPDGFSEIPKIRIISNSQIILEIETVHFKPSLVQAGRHATGQCGFIIDDKILPNLRDLEDLSIFEVESGILIYKRLKPDFIQKKILRIDTHLMPLVSLDRYLAPKFQHHATSVERYGKETINQLFLLHGVLSSYMSGRISFRNHEQYINASFKTLLLIQEPYAELAERLLILKIVSTSQRKILNERDMLFFAEALKFARSLELQDLKVLRKNLNSMPKAVAATLSNPVTRQLTTTAPDEMPQSMSLARALDVLSSCTAVGIKNQTTASKLVADLLGLPTSSLPSFLAPETSRHFGEMLRETGSVDTVIEKDLELYNYVSEAGALVDSHGEGTGNNG